MSFLRLEGLCKSYSEGGQQHQVLHETSISFERGEFVAIVGKSGSGKTTLLNLIAGIDRADCGNIVIAEQSLAALDDYQRTLFRRQKIGFVFQFYNLIPTLTVWENLVLPLELNHLMDQQGLRRAETLLEEVGLANRRKAYPDRLSGGEQQRISIARALVHNPLLVLADEPTGNLDEETGQQVVSLLDRLTRRAGKNLILVTHSLEIAAYADRILLLREGRLVPKTGK